MIKKPKKDTKLESEGAEFLVLGLMLIEGISCYKAYTNFPGYDLVAYNANTKDIARLQVKSRWATNYDKSFAIKNFNCDFVIHVALNRGYAFGKKSYENDNGVRAPEFYVFPINLVKAHQNKGDKFGKVTISNIPDYLKYKERWSLVQDFLNLSIRE
jgi:hypothetical protein